MELNMNDPATLGMITGGGFLILFVIIMIIVIPRQMRKARNRGKEAGEAMARDIEQRLGLKFDGRVFRGNYKGYQVTLEKRLGSNNTAFRDQGAAMIGSVISGKPMSSSMQNRTHGRDIYFPVVEVELSVAGAQFPDLRLYEKVNYFVNTDQKRDDWRDGREPSAPSLDINTDALYKKAKFYGNDFAAAEKLTSSPALKSLLDSWIYLDLRIQGDKVKLLLDNNNIINKWGHKKTSDTDWLVQAVDICASTADALK